MGLGGISIWQLLIILLIVVVLFGTKRLRTLGGDLGAAVRGFRKTMQDDEETPQIKGDGDSGETIDSTAEHEHKTGS